MFQTGSTPGIVLFEGFPLPRHGLGLSARLTRMTLAQTAPRALRRGSSPVSRVLISAEVRCLAGAEAPLWPVPPLSFPPSRDQTSRRRLPVNPGSLLPWTLLG
jgi:hypothetical protein